VVYSFANLIQKQGFSTLHKTPFCVYNGSPMTSGTNKAYKFFLLLISCLFWRLLPFRAPNIEPITASLMPISGALGALAGFSFAISSVLMYDLVTGTLGAHTFFVAGAFAVLGIWGGRYFKGREGDTMGYIRFAVAGTLFFDAVTGLIPGPLFYGQSFAAAFAGQIPFTMLHLLGNIVFAATLSPAIYHLLIKKRKPGLKPSLTSSLNPKII
jgi:hypothetical protein